MAYEIKAGPGTIRVEERDDVLPMPREMVASIERKNRENYLAALRYYSDKLPFLGPILFAGLGLPLANYLLACYNQKLARFRAEAQRPRAD